MAKILISYRRSDMMPLAARLYDRLSAHFGADLVAIDYAQAQAGDDFRKHLLEAVGQSEILLVLIGPHWRGIKQGERFAIESDFDPIRQEVAAALQMRKMVIPVILEDASMPSPEQLPGDIRNLSYQNCVALRSSNFSTDVMILTKAIEARDAIQEHLQSLKAQRTQNASSSKDISFSDRQRENGHQPKILLSYRRSDTGAIAGRLFDRIRERFGEDEVYMDIDNIPYGTNFRHHIEIALKGCKVLVVLVGPKWLGQRFLRKSRIFDRDDPVRIEVQTALTMNVPLFPILVDGAKMPGGSQLPKELRFFNDINAAPLDSGRDFDHHVAHLLKALGEIVAR
jgi:hypothetical protein